MDTTQPKIFGSHDDVTLTQIKNSSLSDVVVESVLCADGHRGYAHPIGGVVASPTHVSWHGNGPDLACGNYAVRLDLPATEVRPKIEAVMDDIFRTISFGVGRVNNEKVDHPLFDDPAWGDVPALGHLKKLAQDQLGTVGAGNHYVDVFEDENGYTWVGCHFGSRGFGYKHAYRILALAGARDDQTYPLYLDAESELGQEYLRGMKLAGRYADAGRRWVVHTVCEKILGAPPAEEVSNHHNFSWREEIDGVPLWVTRKGSTPNWPGQRSFVGGSMGHMSVILEGTEKARETLYSTVHGAGRVLGRNQAKGKYKLDKKTGVVREVSAPMVPREAMNEWLGREGVCLRGGDLDESPQCYRDLADVLEAMGDTVKVIHRLKPIGVAMAPPDTRDPYKD